VASFGLLFAGYLQVVGNLPLLWKWSADLLYTRYAFEALSIVSFHSSKGGGKYLSLYEFNNVSVGYCVSIIVGWFFTLQFLLLLGLFPPLYRVMWQRKAKGNNSSSSASSVEKDTGDAYVMMDKDGNMVGGNNNHSSSSSSSDTSGSASETLQDNEVVNLFETLSKLEPATTASTSPASSTAPYRPPQTTSTTTTMVSTSDRLESGGIAASVRGGGTSSSSASSAGPGHGDSNNSNSADGDAAFSPAELAPQLVKVPKSMLTTLTFQRIKYINDAISESHSPDSNFSEGPTLQGISGQLFPGSLSCIVDASQTNAETLLLRILASRSHFLGKTTGIICANDARIGAGAYYLNAAFVQVRHCCSCRNSSSSFYSTCVDPFSWEFTNCAVVFLVVF
jgi:hypothetical protein